MKRPVERTDGVWRVQHSIAMGLGNMSTCFIPSAISQAFHTVSFLLIVMVRGFQLPGAEQSADAAIELFSMSAASVMVRPFRPPRQVFTRSRDPGGRPDGAAPCRVGV
jgi:hypothetical protein